MSIDNDVVSYYDTIAAQYDSSRFSNSYGRFIDAQERRILNRLIGDRAGRRILEMACGTGRLTGYATHGLDASDEMMAFARQRHSEVEFTMASATDTGFADSEFDMIYSFHLLMHLDADTIGRIIGEAHRILKPGGHLIIDIPSRKRRKLTGHRRESWHGSTALSTADIKEMTHGMFDMAGSYGIMMTPVHKLPEALRRIMPGADYALANGILKEYSSYLVFDLIKKQ